VARFPYYISSLSILYVQVASVKVGPVVKRDVMKASVMLEHEEKYTIILAFDVKIERDAQEMADNMGVKIFQVRLMAD
jgi:translation initiation factor 5B